MKVPELVNWRLTIRRKTNSRMLVGALSTASRCGKSAASECSRNWFREVTVWAARRGFSSGPTGRVDPVEVRRQGDMLIVYGCESHGMYAEGFDAKTGECQFRFCTCYWFDLSEAWSLK
jgi:hypothetical protein